MKTFLKKAVSLALALCLILSAMGTVTFAAGREYAAKAYINDVPVGFINAPYQQDGAIFVPLKEACEYMNIALTEENGSYTLTHGTDSVTMQEGNMFVQKNGQSVMLSAQSWNKGGVIFVPTELFSAGLEIDLTADTEARRVYFRPNIYRVYITEQNAALINLEKPDEDLLHTGAAETDDIIYNENLLSTIQISLLYKFDLGFFAGKTITDARLTAYCGLNSNLNPYLGAIRTEQWEKGMTYSTAPKHYEGASIKSDPTLLTSTTHGQNGKNYLPHTIVMTDWAKDSLFKGEQLSVKLLGIPQTKSNSSAQIRVKGVNTPQKAYLSVTVDEQFNFPVAEAEKETDIDRNTFEKLGFLTRLGVFTEGEEFPADLTTGVTRREFVSYAIRLMNDFEYNEDAAQIFADVAPKSASYGAIMDCAALGLISSGEGIEFRPDDIITYDEAVTIIGRMLGYGTYAEKNGGFSAGFVSAALKSDLLKGVRNHSGKIGFDSMFNLFFNALEAPMFEASVYFSTGDREYTFNSSLTLLSEYWNLKKVEGTMQGNEYTNLNPDILGTSGKVIIDGKNYNISNPDYNFLLGYKVKGYYDKEDNLLYLGAEEHKNDSDVIDLHTVTNVTKSGAINFTYEDKNGKNNTDSIQSSDKIIYNGKSIKFSQLTPKLLDKDTGSITYLNDSIVIINAYTTVVVYNVDEKEEVITDKYAPYDNTLRLKDTDYYAFRDEEGNTIPFEKLAAGDVISAAVSLDKKFIIGDVSKTKLTGKVTAITDENEIEINGNLYETIGENLSWLNDIKLGTQGTFLLDVFGFVAGFDVARATDNVLGYALTSGTSGTGINPKLQLGLITSEAEKMVAYNLAEKVVIDGVSCKTHDAILKALGDTDGIGSSTDIKKQGIVFSVNQSREINKIDTAAVLGSKEIEETSLQPRYNKSTQLRYKSGRLGDLFFWDRNTALNVMFTGDTAKPEEVNDTEKYQYFRSGLTNDTKYSMTVYSIGKSNPNADILVVNSKPSTSVSGTIAIAGKQVYVLNEDGYYDRKLYYYTVSTTASSAIISSDFDTIASSNSKTVLANLNPGDIIRVGKDFNGNLTAIARYYDYKNKKIESNPDYSMDYFHYDDRIYGGIITNKYGSAVRFTNDIANVEKNPIDDSDFRWIKLDMNSGNNKNVFKYEVEGNDVIVSKATADDAVDYAHVPYAPSGIMLQTTYAQQIDAAYIINVEKPANTGIYKITFEPGENATGTMNYVRKDINDTFNLPANEFRHNSDEYAFDGWSYNERTYSENELVTVTGDMTFVAKWKHVGRQYKISFNGNGATGSSYNDAEHSDRRLAGAAYTLPANTWFDKTGGYKFLGWKCSTDSKIYEAGDSFTMPTSDVTFSAVWIECWDGETYTTPQKDGDYYLISNAAELAGFSKLLSTEGASINAKLTADIYLNFFAKKDTNGDFVMDGDNFVFDEEWYKNSANITAANDWNSFMMTHSGIFDGNGKSIYGLYATGTDNGLFKLVSGTVKKLNVLAGCIEVTAPNATSTSNHSGMLAAKLNRPSTVEDIVTSGLIRPASGKYMHRVGGIAGYIQQNGSDSSSVVTKITRCTSKVNITTEGGGTDNITTTNDTNKGNFGYGGIVGVVERRGYLTDCTNEGHIYAPNVQWVGGIIGITKFNTSRLDGTIVNKGNITAYTKSGQVVGDVYNGVLTKNGSVRKYTADLNADTSMCKGTLTLTAE